MSERQLKNLKQAVIAALCDHPNAKKYHDRAFPGDPLPDVIKSVMAQQEQALTKADFLVVDDDGKLIIDSDAAWKNFDKILGIVQKNGDNFTYDDFTKPLVAGSQKYLLDCARLHAGLGKVFTFEAWKGRYDEMERLWYKVPMPDRKALFGRQGMMSTALKSTLFAAEGRITPEDRLAKAGLTPDDIRAAFNTNTRFEEVCKKLQLAGDYLRKEYLLMPDAFGDTVFCGRMVVWDKYDSVVQIMKDHGERLEVADYIRQVSFSPSILGRSHENHTLDKIFVAAQWVDRLPDMLTLWSHVKDAWKTAPLTTRGFDAVYAEAESQTYMKDFEALPFTGKADLLKPLNAGSKTEKPVLPLGLKAVWDKFELVQQALDQQGGDKLQLADLRVKSGEMENSCLIVAAKSGAFEKVVGISRRGGGVLTMEDFLSKDRNGNTLINLLSEKNQLALAFAPDLWAGRVAEMKTLWLQVRAEYRPQVDFRQAEVAAKQATLKQKKGGIKLAPRRNKGPEQ